ncbi:glycosyltransferase [Salinicoccus hispanicus]|uniref:Glycosyltransferase n=1 Tax=Salinicoccus hispanicus TaxID=157225 RepID=A0A6N8U5S6_9STAP|nr:glycosyltransferase [Salinicoccus hispanicus]MXQ50969.1 glycosyltransferase [Salinicoccus hispanicus]
MKVLFVHDGPIRRDDANHYYGIAHNNDLFNRYKVIAENIEALIRVKRINESEIQNFSELTLENFTVKEVPDVNSPTGILKNKIKANQVMQSAIRETDYVIVRLHSMIGLQALKYVKKYNKPYLIELVGCPWDAYWNHSATGKLVAPYMYKKVKKEVWNSQYTLYVTNEFLQNRYPTKGHSINCSNVIVEEVDGSVLSERISKIKNNDGNKTMIGTTASVAVKYKGQQYIIEALGKLKEKGINNFEYQLVGDGNQDYLREVAKSNKVEDKVKFLGPKTHDEVLQWLDSIDLYAQPSKQEGLPRAVIEAMSRGLPSIGANTAGIPELLEKEYIFNRKMNIEEIANLLLSFNETNLIEQAKRNFKVAEDYYYHKIEGRRSTFFKKFAQSEE